jgi:hypothetical protein
MQGSKIGTHNWNFRLDKVEIFRRLERDGYLKKVTVLVEREAKEVLSL